MTVNYLFVAEFTKNGAKATPANAPTIDIADLYAPAGVLLVSAGVPTQLTNMTGVYVYSYDALETTKPVAIFRTADTSVDLVDLPSYPIAFDVTNGNVEASTPAVVSLIGTPANTSVSHDIADVSTGITFMQSLISVISAKLGAFANDGSGLNTVIGYLRAVMRSDAGTPTNLGGTYDPAVDSLQAIAGSGGGAPTVQQIVDGVWDETLANHLDAGSTGEALLAAGAGAGTGFYTVQIPCEVSGVLTDGIQVRVTNDIAGAFVVAQATSDTNGIAVVYLDAGSYYAFLQRGGDTFPNPTLITVP